MTELKTPLVFDATNIVRTLVTLVTKGERNTEREQMLLIVATTFCLQRSMAAHILRLDQNEKSPYITMK